METTSHQPIQAHHNASIRINSCNARHELALIRQLVETHGWKEDHLKQNVSKADIYWLAGIERELHYELIQNHTIFNKLPGVDAVSNKSKTATVFKLMHKFHRELFDFVPQTFNMPEEAEELKEFMASNSKKTFICKPDAGSEGCGIILAKKFKDLPRFVFEQNYVV